MANVKNGNLVRVPAWWKHLRYMKKAFWSKHRQVERRLCDDAKRVAVHPGS